jgi:hypothetical protein
MMSRDIPMALTKAGIWKAMQENSMFFSIRLERWSQSKNLEAIFSQGPYSILRIEEVRHPQTAL